MIITHVSKSDNVHALSQQEEEGCTCQLTDKISDRNDSHAADLSINPLVKSVDTALKG